MVTAYKVILLIITVFCTMSVIAEDDSNKVTSLTAISIAAMISFVVADMYLWVSRRNVYMQHVERWYLSRIVIVMIITSTDDTTKKEIKLIKSILTSITARNGRIEGIKDY